MKGACAVTGSLLFINYTCDALKPHLHLRSLPRGDAKWLQIPRSHFSPDSSLLIAIHVFLSSKLTSRFLFFFSLNKILKWLGEILGQLSIAVAFGSTFRYIQCYF